MQTSFRPKSAAIIHETFDDEVVIVNLDSGDYFSLSGVGVLCWECLLAGCSVDAAAEAVAAAHEGPIDEITAGVQSLVDSMLEQGIIAPNLNGAVAAEPPRKPETGEPKKPFAPPALNRYSDMRDLLLIDPIHEVDETGWPEVKKGPEEADRN